MDGRYTALFQISFEEGDSAESPSLAFLREVSNRFCAALTDLPELELLREKAMVRLDEDAVEALLRAVPFGPGTENIGAEWIAANIQKLNAVFAAEVKNYKGSVQLYLTEKSQSLRVPERIFFHLVESREPDGPIALCSSCSQPSRNCAAVSKKARAMPKRKAARWNPSRPPGTFYRQGWAFPEPEGHQL